MVDDRKSSTMNSMFIGSVLSKPNVESIINAVATILHSQMLEVPSSKFKALCRTKAKEGKFPRIVIFSFSLKKNIFWKSQRLSINKGLHC